MQPTNFRNPVLNEPRIFGGNNTFNTPAGVVTSNQPPPIPPRPSQQGYGSAVSSLGNRFSPLQYGYSGFAGGYGGFSPFGYNNGFNGYGVGVYGNNYGLGSAAVPEHRFIQLAEESSRPAFQKIESLVGAFGNIAAMLDSTFFALTSSFRAILGVAASFANLRGVFAQFWTSFALFRWVIWAYRRVLYWLKLTQANPSKESFNEAFEFAETDKLSTRQQKGSSMPVILFLAFIMAAPYLLMKLCGNTVKIEKAKNPRNWIDPLEAVVLYNFDASNSTEMTIRAGQTILIAPKAVQIEQNLLNTGWVLATADNVISGLIPVNYIQGSKQQQYDNGLKLHSNEVPVTKN